MGGLPEGLSDAVLEAARAAGIGITVAVLGERDGRILWVSPRAAEILGRSVDSLLAAGPLENVAPGQIERLRENGMRRARGEDVSPSFETVVIGDDGGHRPISVAVSYVQRDGERLVISFIEDIRERKRTESALLASESRLRTVVEGAPDGVAITRNGVLLWANRATARLLGAESPASLVGRSLGEFLDPEGMRAMRERIGRLFAGASLDGPHEYRARRPDGTTVVAEIASIVIEWEGAPAILAFARDVTERATLQARLAHAERLAAVGTLAAGVAHEINNPLTFVTLGIDALERGLDDGAPRARIDALMNEVRQGAARVAAIVRELSLFSRADDDARVPIDLASVLASSERLVAHALRGRARVVHHVEASDRVLASSGRLEQVFVNLLLNAVQALPEGDTDNVIEITTRASPAGTMVVEVRDHGEGIAPEHLSRVFDPFFTTKAPGLGTGLGLSVCHRIVTQLGGEIAVESAPGRGTVVRVSLPRSGAEEKSPLASARERPPRRRVLIVDDEGAMVMTLRFLLERDHDVVATTDAHEALRRLLEDEPYDIVFCDLAMPRLDGVDIFERVVARRPELRERFVFITGGAYTTKTSAFLEAARPRCVHKPFRIGDIDELLHGRKGA